MTNRGTRIGVMVPSTNTTVESDYQRLAPAGMSIHGQRLWLTNDAAGAAGMDRMNAEVETGARYLATAKVDGIVYGCTTGSFYRGPGWDKEMLSVIEREAGVPAAGTSPSVVEALRFFKARRVSVATPYPDWNNQQLRAYLEALGFEVLNVEGEPRAARSGNQGINDFGPEDVLGFAPGVVRPEADALLCSCTAWRSVECVGELERRTGKPVVTSNQASFWMICRRLGLTPRITGFGRLLESLAAPAPAAA
jgi:maleate cis-trans isomerase